MIEFKNKIENLIPNVKNKLFILMPDLTNKISADDYITQLKELILLNLNYIDYVSCPYKCKLYTGYPCNEHHPTTEFFWKYMRKDILSFFNIENDDENTYSYVSYVYNKFNISFHEKIDQKENFEFQNFTQGTKFKGNHYYILRSVDDNENNEYVYSCYHRLFRGSHQFCKILNKNIQTNRRLLIAADSMSIPLIPILSYYFDEILYADDRFEIHESCKSFTTYKDELLKFNATDFLSIYQLGKYINNTCFKYI